MFRANRRFCRPGTAACPRRHNHMSELLPAQQSLSRPEAVTAEIGILFVDLDGSLIASNMLVESCLRAIRHDPKVLFKAPLWLAKGRIAFKSHVAEYPLPDV